MGLGDAIMATALARGAHARGKRVALGDGKRILWDQHSAEVFAHNPNIAKPGSESAPNLHWVHFYKSNRIYNKQVGDRWVWNMDFRAAPGEIYFTDAERSEGKRKGKGFILVEPNVPAWKQSAPNKDWGRAKYQAVVDRLLRNGHRVAQFVYSRSAAPLAGVIQMQTRSFRDAAALLRCAALYIGPEGGLHHAAAAVDVPGVVLFGGFIPPQVTGYDLHTNLTGDAEACGSLRPCDHCRAAMDRISVDEVVAAAKAHLKKRAA